MQVGEWQRLPLAFLDQAFLDQALMAEWTLTPTLRKPLEYHLSLPLGWRPVPFSVPSIWIDAQYDAQRVRGDGERKASFPGDHPGSPFAMTRQLQCCLPLVATGVGCGGGGAADPLGNGSCILQPVLLVSKRAQPQELGTHHKQLCCSQRETDGWREKGGKMTMTTQQTELDNVP